MTEQHPLNEAEILAIDRAHIWHPYSAVNSDNPLYSVASARGVELQLHNGSVLIDGMASWWCVIHGYNHPRLNAAANRQIDTMSHVMFGGLTHEPAARLAQNLVRISPEGLNKVFFCDSGSVSVEVAMKMALQYWQSQGHTHKTRFLSLNHAYHGDTFGAMSVCDPVNGMHHLFSGALMQQDFYRAPPIGFDAPTKPDYIAKLDRLIRDNQQHYAAVILEPIVQNAGGMRFYSPSYLTEIKALCEQHKLLLIADEIATGFGRTGRMFACEHAAITPDILCLGKALTGGYLSLAATLCTDKVADTIDAGVAGVLMHGPTYMANPLACAIANESIALLESQDWQAQIRRLQNQLHDELSRCTNMAGVRDTRVLGGIGVVEMEQVVNLKQVQPLLVEQGVWLRPFGKLIYTMPAYCMQADQLSRVTDGIVAVIQSLKNHE